MTRGRTENTAGRSFLLCLALTLIMMPQNLANREYLDSPLQQPGIYLDDNMDFFAFTTPVKIETPPMEKSGNPVQKEEHGTRYPSRSLVNIHI